MNKRRKSDEIAPRMCPAHARTHNGAVARARSWVLCRGARAHAVGDDLPDVLEHGQTHEVVDHEPLEVHLPAPRPPPRRHCALRERKRRTSGARTRTQRSIGAPATAPERRASCARPAREPGRVADVRNHVARAPRAMRMGVYAVKRVRRPRRFAHAALRRRQPTHAIAMPMSLRATNSAVQTTHSGRWNGVALTGEIRS